MIKYSSDPEIYLETASSSVSVVNIILTPVTSVSNLSKVLSKNPFIGTTLFQSTSDNITSVARILSSSVLPEDFFFS